MLVRPLIIAGIWVIAAAAAATVPALAWHEWWLLPAVVMLAVATLGTWDLAPTRHTILRLYPILARPASPPRTPPAPGPWT